MFSGPVEISLLATDEYGLERKEGHMFLVQVLEARVTRFVNPTYSYVAKVQKKYLEWTGRAASVDSRG